MLVTWQPSKRREMTPPARLGLLASSRWQVFPGRAARGSVAPRKMACRPAAGEHVIAAQAINPRTGALPLSNFEANGCVDPLKRALASLGKL